MIVLTWKTFLSSLTATWDTTGHLLAITKNQLFSFLKVKWSNSDNMAHNWMFLVDSYNTIFVVRLPTQKLQEQSASLNCTTSNKCWCNTTSALHAQEET